MTYHLESVGVSEADAAWLACEDARAAIAKAKGEWGKKMMKEHPIQFKGEMVRAILDGRKTRTRRVIKPQPEYFWQRDDGLMWPVKPGTAEWLPCPYGKARDVLWVRECFGVDPYSKMQGHDKLLYRATQSIDPDYPIKWKPSIYMPRWASRITLEVTDVRVERVV